MNEEIEKIVEKESGNASRGGIEGGSFVIGVITTLMFGVMAYAWGLDSTRDAMRAEQRRSDVYSISSEDFNGDGREDMVVTHSDKSRSVYLKQEDGSYKEMGRMIPAENGE